MHYSGICYYTYTGIKLKLNHVQLQGDKNSGPGSFH